MICRITFSGKHNLAPCCIRPLRFRQRGHVALKERDPLHRRRRERLEVGKVAAVLVEFFAYWCGPCAKQVPHMNELSERLGPRGLSILGVASEHEEAEKKKTLAFVEKHGFAFGHAFDTTSKLSAYFRVQSIPFSVLVDPSGVVVWSGHPARLTDELIEKALAGALKTPLWEWPAPAQPLADLVRQGKYAQALELARTLEVEIDGVQAAALVQQRIQALATGLAAGLESAVTSALRDARA